MTEQETLQLMQRFIENCFISFRKTITGAMSEFEKGQFYALSAIQHQLGVAALLQNTTPPNFSELMTKINRAKIATGQIEDECEDEDNEQEHHDMDEDCYNDRRGTEVQCH